MTNLISHFAALAFLRVRALARPSPWLLVALLALWLEAPLAHAQNTPHFTGTGSLVTARSDQSTTLLPNGQVLIVGGLDVNSNVLASAELYDPTSGTWTATGPLTAPRVGHTATLLPNGKVLAAGGYNSTDRNLASAELYDPASGTWTATGPLTEKRVGHTATLLPGGRVLVAGGADPNFNLMKTADLYDPVSGTWTATGPLAVAREFHTATLLPTGKVLVAGGLGSAASIASAELYDPASGAWTATASLTTERSSHTATLLPTGKVLVAGGVGGAAGDSFPPIAELYDPASGTWTATGPLQAGRCNQTATLLPSGQVLVAGGLNGSNSPLASAELYDPVSGVWTATADLTTGRNVHAATLLPTGQVLIAGGDEAGSSASAELYDPAGGSWSGAGPLAIARFSHTATLLPTGQVLVAGGKDLNDNVFASAELYDPASGTWAATGPLTMVRSSHTATLLPNGQVLVAGGLGVDGAIKSAELYDPAGGTWTATGSLTTERSSHTATLLPNGQVLVAGGVNGSSRASAELYDPATGNWSSTGPLATARFGHTATLLPTAQVLVAGGTDVTGHAFASAELYDPASGTWTATGTLASARDGHTATLLPTGQVLVAGGLLQSSSASAELYDPATGNWSSTGSLATGRDGYTATLLPNGRVLVAGGGGTESAAELYDPASGTWMATGTSDSARHGHTATLLPGGQVLVAGGQADQILLASAELYDVGLGFPASARPHVAGVLSPLREGGALVLGGSGFNGLAGGSGGTRQDSSTNYPVVQLRSLENGQSLFLPASATLLRSDENFVSEPIQGLFPGYVSVTVFTNGIPSESAIVLLQAGLPTATTLPATGVTGIGATLHAAAGAGGTETTVSFEYSTDPALRQHVTTTAALSLPPGADGSPVSQTIAGLTPDTTYYYRAHVSNSAGLVEGNTLSFNTPADPVYFFSGSMAPRGGLVLRVLAELVSHDGGTLKLTAVSAPHFGAATISSDGRTILYTPRVSFATLATPDIFTFTYTDSVSQQVFTSSVTIGNPAFRLKGIYDALVTDRVGKTIGYVEVSLTGTGALTGTLKLGRVATVLRGQFALDGEAVMIGAGATVVLTIDPNGDLRAFASEPLTGDALLTRANYSLASNPAPAAGGYTVLLPAPVAPSGTTATAGSSVTNGKISGVVLTATGNGGSGYLAAPVVYLSSPTGSGAVVLATVSGGAVTGFTIVNGGHGYPSSGAGVKVAIESPSAHLPAGLGYAVMTVTAGGSVALAGKLGDGAAWSASGLLKDDHTVAFYTALPYKPGPGGALSGTLTLEDLPGSDADGALTWIKPPQTGASLYPGGFSATIPAIASRYIPPAAKQQALVFANTTLGAAAINLQGGDLATSISDQVTVSSADLVHETSSTAGPAPGDKLKLIVTASSGFFSGSFTGSFAIGAAPAKALSASFSGVLFQKQNFAKGLYLEGNHSGAVSLSPQ